MSNIKISAPHRNNFDFIRILAALLVLYSHQHALTGSLEPSLFGMYSLGGAAVIIFFVISGYLVMSSWERDPNILRFGWRRFLRIWPALAFVVISTAYVLGAWTTELSTGKYLSHKATFDYMSTLLLKIRFVLPGVFEKNPYPRGVNGSLWTIPFEVRCYVVLGIAGMLGLLKHKFVIFACVAVFMAWFLALSNPDVTGTINYGRQFSAYFLSGVLIFAMEIYWRRHPIIWLIFIILIAAVAWTAGWRYTAALACLPFLIIYAGTSKTPIIRDAGRWGDPSYGMYLYAFPVQQTIILYTWPQAGFMWTLISSALITIILSYASWHFIEKQALKLRPRQK